MIPGCSHFWFLLLSDFPSDGIMGCIGSKKEQEIPMKENGSSEQGRAPPGHYVKDPTSGKKAVSAMMLCHQHTQKKKKQSGSLKNLKEWQMQLQQKKGVAKFKIKRNRGKAISPVSVPGKALFQNTSEWFVAGLHTGQTLFCGMTEITAVSECGSSGHCFLCSDSNISDTLCEERGSDRGWTRPFWLSQTEIQLLCQKYMVLSYRCLRSQHLTVL